VTYTLDPLRDTSSTAGELTQRGNSNLRIPWDRKRVGLLLFTVIGIGLSIWSLRFTRFSLSGLINGVRESGYFSRALPPSFEGWQQSLRDLGRTFAMAVAGTGLAGLLSVPLGVMAATNTAPNRLLGTIARTTIAATRAIPDLILAVFFVAALSLGELPGVLALGIHSIGMLGKLLADAIEEIDPGPLEAAQAVGGSRLQAVAASVAPQVMPSFVSNLLHRLDINVRVSIVLGFVGAGGIGFSLRSNLRNPLRYPVGIGQALMVFALIVIVDQVSSLARRSMAGLTTVRANDRESSNRTAASAVKDASPNATKVVRLSPPWTREHKYLSGLGAVLLTMFVSCAWWVGLTPTSFVRALTKSGSTLKMFFPPDFSTYRPLLFSGIRETLALGLAATFLGLIAAIPFAFLCARSTSPNGVVCRICRTIQLTIRSTPELVIVLLFVSAVGLGPLPGTAALAIGTFGFVSKLLSDQLEVLSSGAREGVRSAGATRMQEISSAVTPQFLPTIVGTSLYAFDVNVRASSVLGLVGAGGIGAVLDQTMGMLQYETVTAIIIVLFVVVMIIQQLSLQVRRRLL
jgi:phosphonate transport system permease protein